MPEASEVGSRTLSRFGGRAEQIYLVIRDHLLRLCEPETCRRATVEAGSRKFLKEIICDHSAALVRTAAMPEASEVGLSRNKECRARLYFT